MIIRLLMAIALTTVFANSIEPRGLVYEDLEDTTSMNSAYELTLNELTYAEVYGRYDTYDYIKYTATYSRSVFLLVNVSDNKKAFIDVYLASNGLSTPFRSFTSDDSVNPYNMTYLEQGDTIYYKIRCTGECYWYGEFLININPSGMAYYEYDHYNGYEMPHNDGTVANIYYYYDNSVYFNVPNQNFTFHVLFEEAMSIWEKVGNVNFVFDRDRSLFTISVIPGLEDPEVFVKPRPILMNRYYCSEINIPQDVSYYEGIISGFVIGEDERPATLREGVLGITVLVMGLSLGLAMCNYNNYAYNHMRFPMPYSFLGDGDIASFIELWGDANYD